MVFAMTALCLPSGGALAPQRSKLGHAPQLHVKTPVVHLGGNTRVLRLAVRAAIDPPSSSFPPQRSGLEPSGPKSSNTGIGGTSSGSPLNASSFSSSPLAAAGGGGTGGVGGRTGGGGGGGSSGGGPLGGAPGGGNLPELPSGWSWTNLLLGLVGLVLAVPVAAYIRDTYIVKPQRDINITKEIPEAAADTAHGTKSAVRAAASAVKHAALDPIKEVAAAVKHDPTTRAVQHKVEDVKDSADIRAHEFGNKADRTKEHGKEKVRHGVESTKEKVRHGAEGVRLSAGDTAADVDTTGHAVGVKGERGVQRAMEKVSDTAYSVKQEAKREAKGVLEGVKGAMTSVGKKMHIVADSTERAGKKAINKLEQGLGVRHTTATTTTTADRRARYYTAAGAVLGAGLLIGTAWYLDKKGGGKIQHKMKDVADRVTGQVRDAAHTASDRAKEVSKEVSHKVTEVSQKVHEKASDIAYGAKHTKHHGAATGPTTAEPAGSRPIAGV